MKDDPKSILLTDFSTSAEKDQEGSTKELTRQTPSSYSALQRKRSSNADQCNPDESKKTKTGYKEDQDFNNQIKKQEIQTLIEKSKENAPRVMKEFSENEIKFLEFYEEILKRCNELAVEKGIKNYTRIKDVLNSQKCFHCEEEFYSHRFLKIHLLYHRHINEDCLLKKCPKCTLPKPSCFQELLIHFVERHLEIFCPKCPVKKFCGMIQIQKHLKKEHQLHIEFSESLNMEKALYDGESRNEPQPEAEYFSESLI